MINMEEKVIKLVSNILGLEVTAEDTLESLEVDSLDLVEIVIECEHKFAVSIKDDEIREWKTIGDIGKTLEKKVH